MTSSLISSHLRRRLLTHFFSHPEERYYLRELAVLLDLDPGNLSKELRRLTSEGLFIEEQKGKMRFYLLNKKYSLYNDLKQLFFKTEGIQGGLRELILPFEDIRLAFIYGSFAKGEEKNASDVDLMVVGTPDRRKFTSKIRKLEDRLNREINFVLYTPKEFKEKAKEKGSFLGQVLQGKKILLKGRLHE